MIQADIYGILLANEAVTNIVSTRIFPFELPQGSVKPAVVYMVNDIDPIKSLDGESGIDIAEVEINCWAKTYTAVVLLASAVRSAFTESEIGVLTESMQEIRDNETRNFGIVMTMSAWSEPNLNRSSIMEQTGFTGDGVTTEFPISQFRSDSLLLFKNGRLAKKGLETDSNGIYYEETTLDGIVFRTAPEGGENPDEFLAFYTKA